MVGVLLSFLLIADIKEQSKFNLEMEPRKNRKEKKKWNSKSI